MPSFLHGRSIYTLILVCLIFLLHLVNSKKFILVASILSMQGIPWIILSAFMKEGYKVLHENDSLSYQLFQLSYSYPPSCNPYLPLICNNSFNLIIIFFKVLYFLPYLIYETIFILDELFVLVNLLHQLHSNLSVVFIFKLYLFRFCSRFLLVWLISF